ncbi:MAG: hypothetical protein IPK80_16595 [Nannocystis sp.]|nr:hypothetical protein [Nannocystis sp.]
MTSALARLEGDVGGPEGGLEGGWGAADGRLRGADPVGELARGDDRFCKKFGVEVRVVRRGEGALAERLDEGLKLGALEVPEGTYGGAVGGVEAGREVEGEFFGAIE